MTLNTAHAPSTRIPPLRAPADIATKFVQLERNYKELLKQCIEALLEGDNCLFLELKTQLFILFESYEHIAKCLRALDDPNFKILADSVIGECEEMRERMKDWIVRKK